MHFWKFVTQYRTSCVGWCIVFACLCFCFGKIRRVISAMKSYHCLSRIQKTTACGNSTYWLHPWKEGMSEKVLTYVCVKGGLSLKYNMHSTFDYKLFKSNVNICKGLTVKTRSLQKRRIQTRFGRHVKFFC